MAFLMDTDIVLDALFLAVYSDTEDTKYILEQIVKTYKAIKEKTKSTDKDLEIFFEIINDALRIGINPEKKSEKSQIILKVKKSDLGKNDKTIVESVVNILSEDPKTISQNKITMLQRRLQQWLFVNSAKDVAKKISMRCSMFSSSDDMSNDIIVSDVLNYASQIREMEEHMVGRSETIDVVDMTNAKSLSASMEAYERRRKEGVFLTGLKQLNRMLCPNYGFLRGEFAAFAASSHNFKSGMLMKCARWFCTKSNIKVPEGMSPVVVFISLENEIPENASTMIKAAYIDIYKQAIPEGMDRDELLNKVAEYYLSKHIKLIMYRFDGNFSFVDFVKLMEDHKKKNQCVVATIIDYFTQMRVDINNANDTSARQYGLLAKNFRDYAKRNNMLIVTGLQLNSIASELNNMKKANTVRLYGDVHLAECKAILHYLDILIFLKIEQNMDDISYLTGAWFKHRDGDRPPPENMYFAYRFHPVLGLQEDEGTELELNKPDIYADNLYEDTISDPSDIMSAIKTP